MSKSKLKGLIDYLNTVQEKYTTNKKETLLEIANYTYSYIEKIEKKLKIANELINLILSFKKVEKYEHIRTFAEQAKEQMKEVK